MGFKNIFVQIIIIAENRDSFVHCPLEVLIRTNWRPEILPELIENNDFARKIHYEKKIITVEFAFV